MAFLKHVVFWALSLTLSFAETPEQELIVKVFKFFSIKDVPIAVYEHNPSISLKGSSFTNLVAECAQANVVYGSYFETLPKECRSLPRFTTEYELFQNDERVIGAFYWRKGRPQLRFSKERCERFDLFLPSELVRYVQ